MFNNTMVLHKIVFSMMGVFIITGFLGCGGGGGGGTAGGGTPGGSSGTQYVSLPGSPSRAPVAQTIGTAGGVISDPSGSFTLTIPAGALSTDTTITIQPVTNSLTPWQDTGTGYEISGISSLIKPAQFSIVYSDGNIDSPSADTLGVALQDGTGAWWYFGNASWNGTSMVVTLDPLALTSASAFHQAFRAGPIAGTEAFLYLLERMRIVGESGLYTDQQSNYAVGICDLQTVQSGGLLSFDNGVCHGVAATTSTLTWLVNGSPTGNSTVGTLSGAVCSNDPVYGPGCSVNYTAPSTVPNPSNVLLGAQYTQVTPPVTAHKAVTIYSHGGFFVSAEYYSPIYPVCSFGVPTTVSDSFEFDIRPVQGTSNYDATLRAGSSNGISTYDNPQYPGGFIIVTVPLDVFSATNITAFLTGEVPPKMSVKVYGTATSASCSYYLSGQLITSETGTTGAVDPLTFSFDPDINAFDPATQVQKITSGFWTFTVSPTPP
jgi:hypothetical protein